MVSHHRSSLRPFARWLSSDFDLDVRRFEGGLAGVYERRALKISRSLTVQYRMIKGHKPGKTTMKRLIMAAAALASLMTAAHAEIPLFAHGYWRTSLITKNSDDQPMCTMQSTWDFNSGAQGTVTFKWTQQHGLFIHVAKIGWKLSADTEVPMTFAFDNGVREATGFAPVDGNMIQINVPDDKAVGVMEDFADAKTMTIKFLGGDESPWIGNMTGSRKASSWFLACIAKIGAVASQPVTPKVSQPVAPQPTQPAGNRDHVKDDGGI
jgi:hypothetical protein